MRMLFALILGLLSFIGYSQKLDNSLVWKISGNGLKEPSYLFGTIHITCDASLDPRVLSALKATKQLYLEINMDDPGLQAKMMDGIMMKNGQKMSKMVSTDDFKLVSDFLNTNLGMPATLLDSFKPGLIAMMIAPKMMECPVESIEMELMKATKEQNEQIFGLETVEKQMAIFDAIPYEEQMKELVDMAKEGLDKQKEENKKLDAIYKSQNLKAIADYMDNEDSKMYGNHADVLLTERNQSWIPKIEEAAKATPTLFAVGAAHLGGENGVILLLRKKGYKVEAVK
ncbi:TraB/GumN family protein [Flavobacterium sp. RHBU_3]|uniref:TraB/GumN family protein n=1 Tax=Flavobacterium sp. RHBU_3 TaxID=3391184 RepID=UPI003984EFC9